MQEKHEGDGAAVAEFYKTVVGDQAGIAIFEMDAGVLGVEELEVAKAAAVKGDEQGDDFGVAERSFAVAPFQLARLLQQQLLDGLFKKQTEVVNGEENIGYFVFEERRVHFGVVGYCSTTYHIKTTPSSVDKHAFLSTNSYPELR
jgi:hypothetical protein